jgi:hypothetical protein
VGFNLQLLQIEDTKQQLLDAWKQGMVEGENQGVGSQVARAILLTKKESDTITKQLKLQGKELYRKQFVDIKVVEEELMLD